MYHPVATLSHFTRDCENLSVIPKDTQLMFQPKSSAPNTALGPLNETLSVTNIDSERICGLM